MNPKRHLSEDAINDALIGLASAETHAHLATCDLCRGKIAAFQSQMGDFNAATTAWSEAQPKMNPRTTRVHKAVTVAPWAWATAVVLIAIGAASLVQWHAAENTIVAVNVAPPVVAAPQDSATQIEQDNELMQSVNAALTTEDASPAKEFDLRNVDSTVSTHHDLKGRHSKVKIQRQGQG